MKPELRKAIIREVGRAVGEAGFDVYGVRVGQDRSVHVHADRFEGRITIAELRRLGFLVRDVLENMGLPPDDWFTEVESPGADRVLTEPRHFVRFKGERVKVKLKNASASPRTFNGSVLGCEGGILKMTVEGASARDIPLADIEEARLDPRLPF